MFKFGSKNDITLECKCTVRLLDDNEVLQCVFHRDQKGYHLLDYVCDQLNLLEKDYFGLRYVDETKQRHWLDPSRSIVKQIKGMSPIIFCFRVKFYPPDPHRLKEEITRYQIFLQLRRDLLHGRLYCSQTDSAYLAAYVIQAELGDFDPDEHIGNYITDFKLLLKQTVKVEEKIAEIHQIQLRGQVPSMAENNFLRKACLLDTYGVDPHPVKDQKGNQLYLGINHMGILTFQGSRKTHHFKWQDVQKINYEGKMFIVHLMFNEKKHTIGFKCPSSAACKHLWRCAVEQRIFFTLSSSTEAPSVVTGGSFFSRGSRFRYSGRVEKEIAESSNSIDREPPEFSRITSRSLSFRNKSGVMLASNKSSSQEGMFEDLHSPENRPNNEKTHVGSNVNYNPENTLSTVEEDHEPCSSSPYARHSYSQDNSYSSGELVGNETMMMTTTMSSSSSSKKHHHQQQQQQQQHTYGPSSDMNHIVDRRGGGGVYETPTSTAEVQTNVTGFIPIYGSKDTLFPHRSGGGASGSGGPVVGHHTRGVIAFKLLVPTIVFSVFFISCVVVVILESESELLSEVRRMPELIFLRREYYEPFKEYLKKTWRSITQGSD